MNVVSLDIPELPHAVAETLKTPRLCCLGAGMEDTDVVGPVRRLLRPRRERPGGCRAAEQRDELAALTRLPRRRGRAVLPEFRCQ